MVVLPCVQVPVLAACSVRACVRVCVWAFRLLKNLVCPSKSALFFSFSFVFSLLFVCLVRSLLLTIVFDSSIPACSMSSREGFFLSFLLGCTAPLGVIRVYGPCWPVSPLFLFPSSLVGLVVVVLLSLAYRCCCCCYDGPPCA